MYKKIDRVHKYFDLTTIYICPMNDEVADIPRLHQWES